MNWVGGIRNRVKLKQEKKIQKEFFERKRLQKKLNITNPISVNANASHTNNERSHETMSQDLLALQVIMQTHDKPHKSNREMRQPTKVDLDRPNRHQPKFKNEEILDLPLPSSVKPSTLELFEVQQEPKHAKSPAYPFHRKETTERITQSNDSHFTTTAHQGNSNHQNKNGNYFYEKQTKHSDYENPSKLSKFSEGFDFESKHANHPTLDLFCQKEKTHKNTNANWHNLGLSTAPPTQGSMTWKQKTFPNSFYQSQLISSAQNHIMKRKIDSFELNIFEDVKHTRLEELFLSKQQNTPTSYQVKERYLKNKHSLPQMQQKSRFHIIEEQSPFIPYAAPAPYSLAARNITCTGHEGLDHPNQLKSEHMFQCSTPQRLIQRSCPLHKNYNDNHEDFKGAMETHQPNSRNAEHKELFLAGLIQSNKINHDITTDLKNDDYPLPSPATNKVTIECLNKSDPQSFLTDLQVLEEIMTERKHQPVKTNPDEIMNKQRENILNEGQRDKTKTSDEKENAKEDRSTDDVWRNFITAGKQPNVDTLIREDKKDIKNENGESAERNVSISEDCNLRQSKIAAEELKEVMAVQQYESSQESSYYSSWSSSASENENNKNHLITNSGKLSSKYLKEVRQTSPKENIQTTGVPDMPSTSMLKQLENNTQNQVFTLGLSKGFKHISKPRELPTRNSDENRSNVSLFRIYPLSRSEEKGTQTLPMESTKVPARHKSIQCEIWSTNPSSCTESKLGEDKECFTGQDTKIGTLVKETCEGVNTGTHSDKLSQEDRNTKTKLDNSELTVTDSDQLKTSNDRVPTPPPLDTNCSNNITVKNEAVHLESVKESERKSSNQIIQPISYSAKNIIPDTPLILTQNTDDEQTISHTDKIAIGQIDETTNCHNEPDQNMNVDVSTDRLPTFHGKDDETTIPNDQTDKISMIHGITNETTTPNGDKTTTANDEVANIQICHSLLDTIPNIMSQQIPKLGNDIKKN